MIFAGNDGIEILAQLSFFGLRCICRPECEEWVEMKDDPTSERARATRTWACKESRYENLYLTS